MEQIVKRFWYLLFFLDRRFNILIYNLGYLIDKLILNLDHKCSLVFINFCVCYGFCQSGLSWLILGQGTSNKVIASATYDERTFVVLVDTILDEDGFSPATREELYLRLTVAVLHTFTHLPMTVLQ